MLITKDYSELYIYTGKSDLFIEIKKEMGRKKERNQVRVEAKLNIFVFYDFIMEISFSLRSMRPGKRISFVF